MTYFDLGAGDLEDSVAANLDVLTEAYDQLSWNHPESAELLGALKDSYCHVAGMLYTQTRALANLQQQILEAAELAPVVEPAE